MRLVTVLNNLLRDDRGATAVEYGLIVAMIVLAMLAALTSVAEQTTSMWDGVEYNISEATGN